MLKGMGKATEVSVEIERTDYGQGLCSTKDDTLLELGAKPTRVEALLQVSWQTTKSRQ
jgi:hypothetical protein